MSFLQHEPKTEEELISLIPEDTIVYFTLKSAENYIGSSGKKSIKIVLEFFDENENKRLMTDYITPSYHKKYKHFFDAIGKHDVYQSGNVSEDVFEKDLDSGMAVIGIQKGGNGYPDKNIFKDYLSKEKAAEIGLKNKSQAHEFDDDIPFN